MSKPTTKAGRALSGAEVETIYAAYDKVLCREAKTLAGKRAIVEPLYEAVIRARVARALLARPLANDTLATEAAAVERARLTNDPSTFTNLLRAYAKQARDDLGAAWARVEAALPEGWLFHGVSLADHSMDDPRGGWGPDWMAAMSWPGHCEYDDCDHDEAYRVGYGPTPTAALLALAEKLEALG